jgi:hypothetical protein
MINFNRFLAASILVGLFVCNLAIANPPPGKGNPNNPGHNKGGEYFGGPQNDATNLGVNLVAAGITVLTAREFAVNAGVTGYKPLPPGVAKNLARGKPLPPGIAKRYVPGSMLRQLPQHPDYEWRVAGTDLILVGIQTAIVADVLQGVFR